MIIIENHYSINGAMRVRLTSACISWQADVRDLFTPDALWETGPPPSAKIASVPLEQSLCTCSRAREKSNPTSRKAAMVVSIFKKLIIKNNNELCFKAAWSLPLSHTSGFWNSSHCDICCFVYLGLWVVVQPVSQITEYILLVPDLRTWILGFTKRTKTLA